RLGGHEGGGRIGTALMKIFYGWVIVAAGILISCIGFGAMVTLSVFLQPMAAATGWSRTGISTPATVNWRRLGRGSLPWGRPLRPVRHPRRRAPGRWPARPRHAGRQPGELAGAVPAALRRAGRPCRRKLLRAVDRDHHAVVRRQSQPGRRAGVGRRRPRLDD